MMTKMMLEGGGGGGGGVGGGLNDVLFCMSLEHCKFPIAA